MVKINYFFEVKRFFSLINDVSYVFFFAGDVVLKDLKLKAEALNSLKLPVTVKAGFVGTITLKVAFVVIACTLAEIWILILVFVFIH